MSSSRPRSRSPYRGPREPPRDRSEPHEAKRRHESRSAKLPLNARSISKHEYISHKPLFAVYLDIQKGLYLDDLDEREVRGRWKSFVGKWNHGDLAEGWYDPVTLRKARESVQRSHEDESQPEPKRQRRSPPHEDSSRHSRMQDETPKESDDSDDDIGPAPLGSAASASRAGPAIPSRDDIALRDELTTEDALNRRDDLRHSRKQDRKTQKERLEDLAPRADAGTRERQLEKRAEVRAVHASFKEARDGGEAEVGDGDLMGDGGLDDFKRERQAVERKKNEREIRREEIWRAKAAEREERLKEARAKEDKTMDFLKQLARERFGGGGNG